MQNKFKVNRPLLNVHRFEVRQFVRFWKLPIYSDQSNQKTNYLRNKIRKQLMPTLRIFFNPQIDSVLLNFVEIRKNEHLYFQNVLKFLLKPQECYPLFSFSLLGAFTRRSKKAFYVPSFASREAGGRISSGTPLASQARVKVRSVAATSHFTKSKARNVECLLITMRLTSNKSTFGLDLLEAKRQQSMAKRKVGHSTELLIENNLTSRPLLTSCLALAKREVAALPTVKHSRVRHFYLLAKHLLCKKHFLRPATILNDSYKFNKLILRKYGVKLENNLMGSFFTRYKVNQKMLFSMQSPLTQTNLRFVRRKNLRFVRRRNFYAKHAERKAVILDPMLKGKVLVHYLLGLTSREAKRQLPCEAAFGARSYLRSDGHFLLIPSYGKDGRFYAENTNKLYKPKKNHAKLRIQYKNYLNYFSRNQIVYWLIINNNLIKRLNCYPNIFQKQVLKTILKTFNKVENVATTYSRFGGTTLPLNLAHTRIKLEDTICARGSKQINEKNLTPLLILKFTRKLFVLREKRFLLFILRNLINKY